MERRLAPAMQTCETAAWRLESLSRRLARASDLLRTQVDVALQEQNRDLLLSMDRRARLQSRLQRILEVISIVALTYYLACCYDDIEGGGDGWSSSAANNDIEGGGDDWGSVEH